ncbi:hypothetical protein MMC25_001075 [Agyrium rufum]|nr:hypothetical protein [Agyrium rufum]
MVNVLLLTVLSLLIRFCAAIPQGISISAIPESQSAAPTTCGGCFIGADVIAVIVGDVVEVTATEVTTVSTARNGTQVTVTSTVTVIPETVPFTFTSGGVEPPAPTGTVVAQTGSVVTYLGLTL